MRVTAQRKENPLLMKAPLFEAWLLFEGTADPEGDVLVLVGWLVGLGTAPVVYVLRYDTSKYASSKLLPLPKTWS